MTNVATETTAEAVTKVDDGVLHETSRYLVGVHQNPEPNYDYDYDTPVVPSLVIAFRQDSGEYAPTFNRGYIVKNKATGVIEFATINLAEAIYESERMTDALETQNWKWFQIRRDAMAAGEIEDENKVMFDMMKVRSAKTSRGAAQELVQS